MAHQLTRLRRRMRRQVLRFVLAATVHRRRLQVRFRTQFLRLRFLPGSLIVYLLLVMVGSSVVYRHRVQWRAYSEALAVNGTLPQLGIAVGAAMLGVIGIVFSLSIFSIQQVAERGTTLTLREYANDLIFRIVYWTLAVFAFLAMLSALGQRKESALYRVCLNLGIVAASVLALKVYFERTIKFVDPHFTITKVAKRASKLLRQIQSVERAVQTELRYQRTRRST